MFTRPAESPGLGKAMELPKPDADGFIAMFNGTDLSGWDAASRFWSVKEGAIDCVETAEPGGNVQSDLIWMDSKEHPDKYANFELRPKYRWLSHSGNSGIQFRSVVENPTTKHVGGYQADMDPQDAFTGGIYDESGKAGRRQKERTAPPGTARFQDDLSGRREHRQGRATGRQFPGAQSPAQAGGEFNDMVVIADGPHMIVKVNDHVFCDLTDESPRASRVGSSRCSNTPAQMEIQFKDIKIKLLPGKAVIIGRCASRARSHARAGGDCPKST